VSGGRRSGAGADVSGFQRVAVGGGPAADDLAVHEDDGLVGYLEREPHVLLDEDDHRPGLIRDAADHRKQPFDDHRRDAHALRSRDRVTGT